MAPHRLLLPLTYLLVLVSAASNPTSFCKCTCGANSTIIPLDAPSSSSKQNPRSFPLQDQTQRPANNILHILRSRDSDDESSTSLSSSSSAAATKPTSTPSTGEEDRKASRRKTCNDCNKQYCLSQGLHICEGVKSEDVFTTCFQRDSRKDEAVVFIFIFATAGLLGWAAVKPWVMGWIDRARERRTYTALSGDGGGDGR